MSEAITRAARAACDAWGFDWDEPVDEDETTNGVHFEGDEWPARNSFLTLSRAAILAFLDGEDVVEAAAVAIWESEITRHPDPDSFLPFYELRESSKEALRAGAKGALAALRALVQEEK